MIKNMFYKLNQRLVSNSTQYCPYYIEIQKVERITYNQKGELESATVKKSDYGRFLSIDGSSKLNVAVTKQFIFDIWFTLKNENLWFDFKNASVRVEVTSDTYKVNSPPMFENNQKLLP